MELLIADDNTLSLRFLADAAVQLGHRCDTVGDGLAALALARARRYDLLLLDVRMPGLDGPVVLQRLRADESAASRASAALATTAANASDHERSLRAQGFIGVLAKPVDLAGLQRALQTGGTPGMVAEPAAAYADLPLLDDAAACRSLGSSESVAALRQLFLGELDSLPRELDACLAPQDLAGLRDRLHRLCASAGFCGAAQLEHACRRLRSRLVNASTFCADDLAELRDVAAATRRRLIGA
jgi:CheY-like chemotaxis protein